MRKLYKDAFLKKHNIKLGFMSAFVKAAAHALTDQPAVNAGKRTQTNLQRFSLKLNFLNNQKILLAVKGVHSSTWAGTNISVSFL